LWVRTREIERKIGRKSQREREVRHLNILLELQEFVGQGVADEDGQVSVEVTERYFACCHLIAVHTHPCLWANCSYVT